MKYTYIEKSKTATGRVVCNSLDSSFIYFEEMDVVLGTRAASEPPLVDRIVPDTIVDVHGE